MVNAGIILPTIGTQFDSTGNLSKEGIEDFWNYISKTLQYLDKEKNKSVSNVFGDKTQYRSSDSSRNKDDLNEVKARQKLNF